MNVTEVFSLHVMPQTSHARFWLRAHLEAFDHLALTTDRDDGCVQITGPLCCEDEIRSVLHSLEHVAGFLYMK